MNKPKDPTTAGREAQPRKAFKRRDSELLDTSLQNFTLSWLKALPDPIKPFKCARHYPRVLNKIAAMWGLNERCIDYLNDLLVDHRGDREGFGYGVIGELRRLRAHRASMLPPRDEPPLTDFSPTVPMDMDWTPKR